MKKDTLKIVKIIITFLIFCLTTYLSFGGFFEEKSLISQLLAALWFITLSYTGAMLINLVKYK